MIRSREGVAIATVLAPISSGLHVTARCLSPRLGREVAAEVLEIKVDASLEVLTVIVPGSASGLAEESDSVTMGEMAAFTWADAAGGHRIAVSSAAGGVNGVEVDADLCWWIDSSRTSTIQIFSSELFAAFGVRSLKVDGSERCVTDAAGICGKMIVLERVDGRWRDCLVCEPRRGGS